MKRLLFGAGIALLAYVGYTVYEFYSSLGLSPRWQATYRAEDIIISIDYGRPYKKGRKIFGSLLPYGAYWRTGANEATEVEFSRDVTFGGQLLKKGRYRLYTVPEAARWTLVLNSELGQWGKFDPNYALDVLRVEAPVLNSKDETEQLTIELVPENEGVKLVFRWDRTLVSIPIGWESPG